MRKTLLPATLLAALAGCTVGPNYVGPQNAAPQASRGGAFVRAVSEVVAPTPPTARWWEELGDPTLNELVVRALANNPNVAIVQARLRQARASLREEKANALPNGSASAVYAHARIPGLDLTGSNGTGNGSSGGTTSVDSQSDRATQFDLYNLGFDASWEIDLFGGQRRAVEAARASAAAAEANIADAQVSLTSEVAQAYVNLRDRQQRIALNNRSVTMQEQMLALTQERFVRGTASRLDVTRLQNQLDNTRADITPINAELDAYLDELATLTGDEPGFLDQSLKVVQPLPLPPATVPVGDPAAMIARRPDIRSAERTLASDTAKIGQAEAAKFPSVKFMGIIGVGGTDPSDLTKLDDFTALLAPQLSWNFLDFGRNRARVAQADAARDEAEAQYRQTVLGALRDAEDALSRFKYRRVTVATLARAKASADEAAALSAQRYQAGTTTLIDLLDTRRQQIAAEQSLSQGEAALTGDFISIQKALGLGWSS
jgi:NodT family efflux transporter outer membrane factor (OMF) lipoprotein